MPSATVVHDLVLTSAPGTGLRRSCSARRKNSCTVDSDRHDPGQQSAVMTARRQNSNRGIAGKDEAPEEQRAFLSAPPRGETCNTTPCRDSNATPRRPGENRRSSASRREWPMPPPPAPTPRAHRTLSAQREERSLFNPPGNAGDDSVQRDAKRQQQGQRAYVFHIVKSLTTSRTLPFCRPAAPVSGCCRALRLAWERTWTRISPGSARRETRHPDRGGHRPAPAHRL